GLTLRTALTVALTRFSDWPRASVPAPHTAKTSAAAMTAGRECTFMDGILSAAWRPRRMPTWRSMAFCPRLATGLAFRGKGAPGGGAASRYNSSTRFNEGVEDRGFSGNGFSHGWHGSHGQEKSSYQPLQKLYTGSNVRDAVGSAFTLDG